MPNQALIFGLMLNTGEPLPDLLVPVTEPGQAEKEMNLAQLLGKTAVLFFYPKDSTPGCTTEARNFRDIAGLLRSAGIQLVGCSRDLHRAHCRFIDKEQLDFPLISDHSGELTASFGVWQEKKLYGKTYMGIVRSTFIVRDGKIEKVFPAVKVKEHAREILDYFQLSLPTG